MDENDRLKLVVRYLSGECSEEEKEDRKSVV